jgi:hypothetical protein
MADGPLYHFSEEREIRIFAPRAPLAHPKVEPLVWAVDAWQRPSPFARSPRATSKGEQPPA